MEPPLQLQAPPLSSTPNLSYQESNDSSPRSRANETWNDPLPAVPGGSKLRLMCSYGGHIVPRPHDKSLCYVGGDTRMVVVDRNTSLSDLSYRLSKNLLHCRSFTLKYQIPNEDLDSLISVTTDEDLDNMIDEYDRVSSYNSSLKSSRVRLFLFPTKSESVCSSIGSLLDNSSKTEDWFFSALNGDTGVLNRGFSDSQAVNCLFGLDNDGVIGGGGEVHGGNDTLGSREPESAQAELDGGFKNGKQAGHDANSVPDSPMLDTTSSFGSTSSPSLANLPPIRVQVEENSVVRVPDQKLGIEEQFAQINVAAAQKQYEGFVGLSSPPPPMPTSIVTPTITSTIPMTSVTASGVEYQNRVFSDDDRSDQGIPIDYRRPAQPLPQPQTMLQQQTLAVPHQLQQMPTGGVELPSPDSVSSDGSLTNAMYRQNPMIYQESVSQKPLNIQDPNTRVQIQQQVQESGYIMQSQFDQQQQQQQQFVHGGQHYIQHHPSGQVPISSYYPVYPSSQQNQQYPVYYMPARQQQPYNMSMQPTKHSETMPSRVQTPPNPGMINSNSTYIPARNAPPPMKTENASGVYRTAAGPPLVQPQQQQYVGYSQVHHPPQSMGPTSVANNSNYAYDYADPNHSQIYYTQPYAPSFPTQYQTMTSALPGMLPETSSQPLSDQMKQQNRTS